MHYEIRSQKSSSSDPPTTGSTVTQGLPDQRPACHRQGSHRRQGGRPRDRRVREGGTAIPSPATTASASIVPMYADRPCHRGSKRNDPGCARPSAATYPGHTAGPVLQHRPSETLPGSGPPRRASDVFYGQPVQKRQPPLGSLVTQRKHRRFQAPPSGCSRQRPAGSSGHGPWRQRRRRGRPLGVTPAGPASPGSSACPAARGNKGCTRSVTPRLAGGTGRLPSDAAGWVHQYRTRGSRCYGTTPRSAATNWGAELARPATPRRPAAPCPGDL